MARLKKIPNDRVHLVTVEYDDIEFPVNTYAFKDKQLTEGNLYEFIGEITEVCALYSFQFLTIIVARGRFCLSAGKSCQAS